MPIETAQQRENLAVEYGVRATHASLHSADPGSTGANEISGGSPAYARKPLTWSVGTVDGVVTATAVFDVPAGQAVTHGALWTALTGGTYLDKVSISYATQASQGTLTLNLTYTQS